MGLFDILGDVGGDAAGEVLGDAFGFPGLGTMVSSALGYLGQQQTNQAQMGLADRQMAFQADMANTAHQREVKDLAAAGLNPMLSYMHGGAPSPSGAMATLGNPGAAAVSAGAAAASVDQMRAQTDLLKSQTETQVAQRAYIEAQTHQATASAGQAEATTDSIRQEMQAFDTRWSKLSAERDQAWQQLQTMGYRNISERVEAQKRVDTLDAEISQARSQASRLSTQAQLLKLDVPAAVNDAAFEESKMGHGIRYAERGAGVVGKVLNSASTAARIGR